MRGGLEKAAEVGCAIVGGHTIRNPEPIYGLAVTGAVKIKQMMTNAKARPNDLLVLTKPLGTGIVTTAIKRRLCSPSLRKTAIALMSRVNSIGARIAELGLADAATDITGFGLVGHLASMCRASGVSAVVNVSSVPMIDPQIRDLIRRGCVAGGSQDNLKLSRTTVDWGETPQTERILLSDAQTSGGLLLAVAPPHLPKLLRLLQRNHISDAVIGRVTRRRNRLICVKP